MKPLKFKGYPPEKSLCVLTHLAVYLKLTKPLRKTSKLFISHIKPHQAVAKDTISRWCKNALSKSGININVFQTHSCRAAASSKAKMSGIKLTTVIDGAGWNNERTFALYYEKPILENKDLESIVQ